MRTGELPPNVVEVPISTLKPVHPVPRAGKPAGFIDDLADQIRNTGYNVERYVYAIELPDGTLLISSGHHRIAAMEVLGESTIPCRITMAADDPVRAARIIGIGRLTGKYTGTYWPTLSAQELELVEIYLLDWKAVNIK